jgi:hypothetical protein
MNDTIRRKDSILPNFLIIGANKSGTNSLYEYLRPHPQVFMPLHKEPSFFAFEGRQPDNPWLTRNIITRLEDYLALFEGAKGKVAIGEASPIYLYHQQAPPKIKYYIPEARLIALLRHPVDRAYSQWQMEIRHGTEKIWDFAKAVEVKETLEDGTVWHRYVYQGMYFLLLKRYYDLFGASQICVLLSDHFRSDPYSVLQKVYQFLKIDPTYIPDLSKRYNEGGLPSNRFSGFFNRGILPIFSNWRAYFPAIIRDQIGVVTGKIKQQGLVKAPELSLELRAKLTEYFRADILQLQNLIQQDLSIWL